MRFLFAVNNYPPHRGGVENHVESLAQQLVKLGHICTVVTLAAQESDTVQKGVRVVSLKSHFNIGSVFSFPAWGTRRKLTHLARELRIDCVSVHTRFFPMTWVGIAVARSARRPSLLTEHGSNFVSGVSAPVALASRLVDVTLGRRALRRATGVLAISDASQRFVQRLARRQSTVFNNAIFIQDWWPQSPVHQERLVFVGRLVPGKGWSETVQAFNALAGEFPNLELDVFGNGPEDSSLSELVAQSPFLSRITVHGAQPKAIIQPVLAGSIFVNPTTLSEGFQTTLIEAAVAQARIVTYPTPGLPELAASGAQITMASNSDHLVSSIRVALTQSTISTSVDRALVWDWSIRAMEFVALAENVLSASATHPMAEEL